VVTAFINAMHSTGKQMKNKGRADDMCSETRKGIEENKKK
jgi:hypothetical protein